MNLIYFEDPNWSLPYWLDWQVKQSHDNLNRIMDINEWVSQHCGELGKEWGHERKTVTLPHPLGLNPVKIKLFYTRIEYSWRFKNKADAMLFKLRWHDPVSL